MITFRSASSVAATATGTDPSGAQQDDVLLASVFCWFNSTTITGASGWTQVRNVTGALGSRTSVWIIKRGSSAPALTWTTGDSGSTYIDIMAFSGASGATDGVAGNNSNPSSTTASSPSVTPASVGMLICGVNEQNGVTTTIPSGMTSVVNRNVPVAIAREQLSASGATGVRTWTFASNQASSTWSVVLEPAPDTGHTSASINYGSLTRTGPNNSFSTMFTAGADVTKYELRTAISGGGTLISSGSASSGFNSISVAYNATGLSNGSNTVYLRTGNASTWNTTESTLTVLRDDSAPYTSTSVSQSPNPITSGTTYSLSFTPSDDISTSLLEMAYQIRTASGGSGSLLTSGSATSGTPVTTSSFSDLTVVNGSTRYIRTRDGAGNWTDTSFAITVALVTLLSVTGAIGILSGSSVKKTYKSISGISGTLTGIITGVKFILKNLTGSVGILSGSLVKRTNKAVSGVFSETGTVVKKILRILTGVPTETGIVNKKTNRSLTGVFTGTGVVNKMAKKLLSGAITLAGVVVKSVRKPLAGLFLKSGSVSRLSMKSVSGILSSITGAFSFTAITLYLQSLTGSVGSLSGNTLRDIVRTFSGPLGALSGGATKMTIKSLSASLSGPTGALSAFRLKVIDLSGALLLDAILTTLSIKRRIKLAAGNIVANHASAGMIVSKTTATGRIVSKYFRGGNARRG